MYEQEMEAAREKAASLAAKCELFEKVSCYECYLMLDFIVKLYVNSFVVFMICLWFLP